MSNFQNYKAVASFARDTYGGVFILKEADRYQHNLVN